MWAVIFSCTLIYDLTFLWISKSLFMIHPHHDPRNSNLKENLLDDKRFAREYSRL